MTALFQNPNQASESTLSHPSGRLAEGNEDGSDAEVSGTCVAKGTQDEHVSSTLSPTLRQLPNPNSSPHICLSPSHRGKGSRTLKAEMPVRDVNGLETAPHTLDRHVSPDFIKAGVVGDRTTKTQTKEGDRSHYQAAPNGAKACERTLKASPSHSMEVSSTPNSLPRCPPSLTSSPSSDEDSSETTTRRTSLAQSSHEPHEKLDTKNRPRHGIAMLSRDIDSAEQSYSWSMETVFDHVPKTDENKSRAVSTPVQISSNASIKATKKSNSRVTSRATQIPDNIDPGPSLLRPIGTGRDMKHPLEESCPSPVPASMPLPPFSLSTYLQLELSSNKPSPRFIHRSKTSEIPYEPSRVKIERLLDFLFLPPQLEQVLWFGTLACLDAFLFSFTILPLRFLKAISILVLSWLRNLAREARFLSACVYSGAGRLWASKRRDSTNRINGNTSKKEYSRNLNGVSVPMTSDLLSSVEGKLKGRYHSHLEPSPDQETTSGGAQPRSQSMPSNLLPEQKADLLKGFLLILSCTTLMYFDASRMYHGIRGQAAIKLYVIYNVLEVSDITRRSLLDPILIYMIGM